MVKILTLDHQYNVQALAALSSRYKNLVFYQQDTSLSLYDNYDIIKPDVVLLNEYYYKSDILRSLPCKVVEYSLSDFIVNDFVSIKTIKNRAPILIIDDKNAVSQQKDIAYRDTYVKVFGISRFLDPIHHQYIGHIDSCKSLHNLINDYQTVFYTNKNIRNICLYLKSSCGKFKSRGTISLDDSEINNLITNTYIYEKYISNFF